MGTFLKVIGALTVLGWIAMGVGCTMLTHAVSKSGAAAYRPASDRSAIVRAMQDGEIDAATLPVDIASSDEVTVTLRDGTRRRLGNGPDDQIVRAMLATKADGVRRDPFESSSYSSRRGTTAQPHFKPGEPMVNPNPGSSYDD